MRKPAKTKAKINFHVQITLSPFEHSVLVQALKLYKGQYRGYSQKARDTCQDMLSTLGDVYRDHYDPHGDVPADQSYLMTRAVLSHQQGFRRSIPRRRRRA